MPEPKEVMLAVLAASMALAGLLLIFVGFVYAHAETFETKRRDRYRYIAKAGLLPFMVSLVCAWLSTAWLTGDEGAYWWSLQCFKGSIALTALYGLVTVLWYL